MSFAESAVQVQGSHVQNAVLCIVPTKCEEVLYETLTSGSVVLIRCDEDADCPYLTAAVVVVVVKMMKRPPQAAPRTTKKRTRKVMLRKKMTGRCNSCYKQKFIFYVIVCGVPNLNSLCVQKVTWLTAYPFYVSSFVTGLVPLYFSVSLK